MDRRLYKSKEDRDNKHILDDRHQLLGFSRDSCVFCKHFEEWDYFCSAYPEGIPDELLEGTEKHNEIRKDQIGTDVFCVAPHLIN
jgi:hypothetical protein